MPEPLSTGLTSEQKREIRLVISVGCDRETAVNFVGCSLEELDREMSDDCSFAADLRRADAGCEFTHMRNVKNASSEEKNWRASVWWLERRARERYGTERRRGTSGADLAKALGALEEALRDEFADGEDWARLARVFARVDGEHSAERQDHRIGQD